MAKQIIVLDQSVAETSVSYRILFWFPINANPQPVSSGSIWTPSGSSVGASVLETQAIQAGTIKEEQTGFTFPVGTPISAIQAVLQQAWAKRNAQINSQGGNQFYGAFFDGAVWGSS